MPAVHFGRWVKSRCLISSRHSNWPEAERFNCGSARSSALRTAAALPFLQELLNGSDSGLWKVALDGLVTLGDNPAIRNVIVETLVAARENANAEKRSWIDEAIEQIP